MVIIWLVLGVIVMFGLAWMGWNAALGYLILALMGFVMLYGGKRVWQKTAKKKGDPKKKTPDKGGWMVQWPSMIVYIFFCLLIIITLPGIFLGADSAISVRLPRLLARVGDSVVSARTYSLQPEQCVSLAVYHPQRWYIEGEKGDSFDVIFGGRAYRQHIGAALTVQTPATFDIRVYHPAKVVVIAH